MKTRADILLLLSEYKPLAERKYGVTKLGLFGSVARDEHTENSDVDICYEGLPLSLFRLDAMQSELEELLGCRVDMVRMRNRMNSLLKQRIQKEGIYV